MDHNFPTNNRNTPAVLTDDVEMEFHAPRSDDIESLPELMETSQSTDSSSSDSGSVQALAEDDSQDTATGYRRSAAPAPSPTSPRNNNRRARVEDDEDEERDRRHPSQRINGRSSDSNSSSQTPSPSHSPPPALPHTARIHATFNIPSLTRITIDQRDPFRFFHHMMPQPQAQHNIPQNANSDSTSGNNDLDAAQQTPQSTNENATPSAPPTPQVPNPQPNGNENDGERQSDFALFADMMVRLGLLGAAFGGFGTEPEADDPERAKKLVKGLEEVPIGLVRRLERIGGTGNEEPGRDTMCAICWDQLLDDAGFGDNTNAQESSSPSKDESEEDKYPKIVSLPCAHVFHADCLIPWYSRPRQTTCPTCRFNIDPENLTRNRGRRSAPRMPAEPPTQPTQPEQQHTADNADNGGHSMPGQNGNDNANRPTGQFGFDQLRIPIIISGQPLFPFNFGDAGNNAGGQGDGAPNNEIMDQLRASVEERLRTGQGTPQPPTEGNNNAAPPVSDDDDPDLPPLEPWQPHPDAATNAPSLPSVTSTQPRPSSQPNPRTRTNNGQNATHSIVFGFDVLVGGPMFGPRPGGNTMEVDEGAGNGGDGRNWMGTMMQDILGGQGETDASGPNAPGNDNDATNADQGPAGMGEAQLPTGFPRFLNMNLGNGESVHIASGSGRTMGEAMAQLLNGMGMSPPPAAPADGNGEMGRDMEANTNTNANANATVRESDNSPQGRPSEMNQNRGQEDEEGNGGTFPGIGTLSMQFLAHMLDLTSPARARRRQTQGQNQQSETTDHSQTGNTGPPPPEEGATPRPTPGNNMNDEGAFARFLRTLAGNLPTGATGQEDNMTPPRMHFFPPGFTVRTDPPAGAAPTQSEKKQWAPPPAPGPTLRQRIEKKEREAGLRCYDMSCGIGPSDEDPLISVTAEGMKQLGLRPVNVDGTTSMVEGAWMCAHTFHPSCLVSTERVALRGTEVPVVGDDVEVSCSVCRGVGRVSKEEWEEGVHQLS